MRWTAATDPLITTHELAARWHTSPGRLASDRSARRDRPPFVRIGSRVRCRLSDVVLWEDSHTSAGLDARTRAS